MKNGYMFFLNIGTLTYIARVLLLVLTVALFFVDSFFLRTVVLVCLAVCLLISIIKAPSDSDVMKALEFFRKRFNEKIAENGHVYSIKGVKVIHAYKLKGRMLLKRTVGYDVIYPNLVSVALANAGNGELELYIDELCLLKKGDPKFTKHVVDASNLRISSRNDGGDPEVVEMTIYCEGYEEGLRIITKKDFHYKEFVEMSDSLIK